MGEAVTGRKLNLSARRMSLTTSEPLMAGVLRILVASDISAPFAFTPFIPFLHYFVMHIFLNTCKQRV